MIDTRLITIDGDTKTRLKVPKKSLHNYPMLEGLEPAKKDRYYLYFDLDGNLMEVTK